MRLPALAEILDSAIVVALPMRERFRGITVRESMIFAGPAGWGEFGPFVEYDDAEAAWWLAAGIEAAYLGPPAAVRESVAVNATVPAVPAADVAAILARFPGAHTAKVKVAEPGDTLDDEVARVAAVRELVPTVRVDANGKWSVAQAIRAIAALGELEYVEQPCATVAELAQVRAAVSVPIAADESIRRAEDPLRVVRAGAADVAVLKVAPLGGMRRVLWLAQETGLPVVVSSALDTAVGLSAGVATAAALPAQPPACGLGTGSMFVTDVAEPFAVVSGHLVPRLVRPDGRAPLASRARRRWWVHRLERVHALLVDGHPAARHVT
ncbi:o-succinylbenzoate synthase [Williamsia sp. CHRR-6]|uniref:o-succinylbenzoate synthase n=1 Tax=Williamsia sp. CHRR-6 TaxID=2835871 RepID=UPI001BDB3839|nr:o-succinylbenzoate synthase [Williamsia sp. CHRR-6]MBT0565790.1 o-succinylbenzoate synthase [Williamsia sp. CHRR-6]